MFASICVQTQTQVPTMEELEGFIRGMLRGSQNKEVSLALLLQEALFSWPCQTREDPRFHAEVVLTALRKILADLAENGLVVIIGSNLTYPTTTDIKWVGKGIP